MPLAFFSKKKVSLISPNQSLNCLLPQPNNTHSGWQGCSPNYSFPAALNLDYGEPMEAQCKEVKPGVFAREWSKASVEMDCNTWQANITMKS